MKLWIEKAYGGMPSETINRKTFPSERDQPKAQVKEIKKSVQSPIVTASYLTPPASSPDTFALDLVTVLLGTGESSRLYKKLVYQDQLATNVAAGCQEELLASRCMIYVYLKPGTPPKSVQKILDWELQALATHKVTAKELQKAKNNYLMEYVSELRKLSGRAQALAYNEIMFGDYQKVFSDIPRVEAVTVDQIQEVVKKYFKPQHKNVVVVVPEGKKVEI